MPRTPGSRALAASWPALVALACDGVVGIHGITYGELPDATDGGAGNSPDAAGADGTTGADASDAADPNPGDAGHDADAAGARDVANDVDAECVPSCHTFCGGDDGCGGSCSTSGCQEYAVFPNVSAPSCAMTAGIDSGECAHEIDEYCRTQQGAVGGVRKDKETAATTITAVCFGTPSYTVSMNPAAISPDCASIPNGTTSFRCGIGAEVQCQSNGRTGHAAGIVDRFATGDVQILCLMLAPPEVLSVEYRDSTVLPWCADAMFDRFQCDLSISDSICGSVGRYHAGVGPVAVAGNTLTFYCF
jgi:hypothetical protein